MLGEAAAAEPGVDFREGVATVDRADIVAEGGAARDRVIAATGVPDRPALVGVIEVDPELHRQDLVVGVGGAVEVAAAHRGGRAKLLQHSEEPAKADGREARLIDFKEVGRYVEQAREEDVEELAAVEKVGDVFGEVADVLLNIAEEPASLDDAPDDDGDSDERQYDGRHQTDDDVCAGLGIAGMGIVQGEHLLSKDS